MTRTPKARIVKAHKLADDLLALWQTDLKPWMDNGGVSRTAAIVDDDLQTVVAHFRDLRRHVDGDMTPDDQPVT